MVAPGLLSNPVGASAALQVQPGLLVPAVITLDPSGNLQGTQTGTTLSAASGTGVQGAPFGAIDLGRIVANPMMVATGTAGISAGQIEFDGSIDGVNWYVIKAATAVAASTTVLFVASAPGAAPARYVRGNITVAFVGGTVSAVVGGA